MIFIDGHVHIWKKYDLFTFFETAFLNFSSAISKFEYSSTPLCLLLFTETPDGYSYSTIVEMADRNSDLINSHDTISFRHTFNGDAIEIVHTKFPIKVILVPGYQLVSNENIEALGLFMKEKVEPNLSLKETIASIKSNNGLTVLPWGVGKWLGRRGKLIEKLIQQGESVFLGDNGNRPKIWPQKGITELAAKYDLGVISGSDPLNLQGGHYTVGSFGSILPTWKKEDMSLEQIKTELADRKNELIPYGTSQNELAFIRSQIALRINK